MASARQISSSICIFKLHNLVIPFRRISTAKLIAPVDVIDEFSIRLVQGKTNKSLRQVYNSHKPIDVKLKEIQNADVNKEPTNILQASADNKKKNEVNVEDTLLKCKHEDLKQLLTTNKITEEYLTEIFQNCSNSGSIEKVIFLKEFTKLHYQSFYNKNCGLDHFLARAYCLRGNSEKGLSILSEAYKVNKKFRHSYRTLFRDLIKDSVSNRSVATLVTFKTFVVKWSEEQNENYPLVCLWHSCWVSSWFCDQTLADELMEEHIPLRKIVADRASAMTFSVILATNDDDAAVRLLQTLLKYKMMDAYEQSLQILFEFRLKNGDARGCREILQNIEVLGLKLCKNLQNKYIHLIINRETPHGLEPVKSTSNFKFEF